MMMMMMIIIIWQFTIHEVTLSVHCFQVKLEFEMLVFVEEEKPEDPQKNPWSKDKNQKGTQSTFDARS